MSHQEVVEAGAVYRRSENFAVRAIDGETILMPVRSHGTGPDNIIVLNETGSLIWRLLAEPLNRDAVVGAVEAEFEVGPEQAEADVEAFLDVLGKAGLIVEVRPEAP